MIHRVVATEGGIGHSECVYNRMSEVVESERGSFVGDIVKCVSTLG